MVSRQIRDPGAFFAVIGEVIARRIDEHADYLAGDDQPGEGYLAKVARLTAARDNAKERVLGEYLLLPPASDMPAVDGNDDDEPAPGEYRPAVVDRGHPSWPRSMPSSGNGSVTRLPGRTGRDRARETTWPASAMSRPAWSPTRRRVP